MIRQERWQKVRQHMARAGLDQLLVSAPASIFYLTGIWVEPQERLLVLYLDRQGPSYLFTNEIFGLKDQPGLPVFNHADTSDPLADLARTVQAGLLGIDKAWPSQFLLALLEKRPDIQTVLGSGPLDLARQEKDQAEQQAMRHSSRINDQVMDEAISLLQAGAVESDLAWQINRLFLSKGADGPSSQLVCFGANGADPHHAPDQTVLQPGDSVIFDLFSPIEKYWCDMTRTVFYQSVSAEQEKVYRLVQEANAAATGLVKPGVPLADLDKAAREIITAAGYGQYFIHRLGHGIGLDCHEPPDVSSSSQAIARPGMVFSIEPGIYLPGRFGVRIEDLVLVTEAGCLLLNDCPKDLLVIS